jgi:type IV secretory pathway VirD2 relaxase
VGRAAPSGEREFRLRPPRPPVPQGETKVWSNSYKALIHLARMTRKRTHSGGASRGTSGSRTRKVHCQRCAVRITYSSNRIRGQWAAHGRYLARESATKQADRKLSGFSTERDRIELAQTLSDWQKAGDPRVFKFILSPEFGERLDLEQLTRELLSRMQRDLGRRLEWAAVAHFNTGHPHVHLVLRGRTDAGPLELERDYIKHGIRQHAENLCTTQLGFRTELDAFEAERREVDAPRVTSLDRTIARRAFGDTGDGTVVLPSDTEGSSDLRQARQQLLGGRLRTLRTMDLAEEVDRGCWRVHPSFLSVLQAMQMSQDRQRMLAFTRTTSWQNAEPRDQKAFPARRQAEKDSPGRGGR